MKQKMSSQPRNNRGFLRLGLWPLSILSRIWKWFFESGPDRSLLGVGILTSTFAVFLIGRSLLFHVFARVLGWLLEVLRNGWRFLLFVGLVLWNSIPSY